MDVTATYPPVVKPSPIGATVNFSREEISRVISVWNYEKEADFAAHPYDRMMWKLAQRFLDLGFSR